MNKLNIKNTKSLSSIALSWLRSKFIGVVLKALGVAAGPWRWIAKTVAGLLFDYFIVPAVEDGANGGLLLIRKKELMKKMKEYMEIDDENFDEAFDDFISGSVVRKLSVDEKTS